MLLIVFLHNGSDSNRAVEKGGLSETASLIVSVRFVSVAGKCASWTLYLLQGIDPGVS